jgi:hypothetical protein
VVTSIAFGAGHARCRAGTRRLPLACWARCGASSTCAAAAPSRRS